MQRIVDGIAYEGKYVDSAFDVVVWEANGHREISAQRVVEWTEIGPAPDWSHLLDDAEREAAKERDKAERRERNLLTNARRAKSRCRRLIKVMGLDSMLTNTYRERMTDERRIKADMARFHRRMAELVPGYSYVTGYEPQGSGSWHAHSAVYRLPKFITMKARKPDGTWREVKLESWRAVTVVWRSIVGRDNGLCFVGGKGPRGKKACTSLAKLAGYISKYITKHYELVPDGKQRYTHSQAGEIPKPQRQRFCGLSLADLIGRVFWVDDGERIVDHRIGKFKDSYYLCTESPGRSEVVVP